MIRMGGGAGQSTKPILCGLCSRSAIRLCGLIMACAVCAPVCAESLYSYRDEAGARVFADRPPEDGQAYDKENRADSEALEPDVTLLRQDSDTGSSLMAANGCYCPAEVIVQLTDIVNAGAASGTSIVRVVPARETVEVMAVGPVATGDPWSFDFQFAYIFGDPDVEHEDQQAYRPPFAAAREFKVSQAFPDSMTHNTAQSRYAVDIVMPEQSGIFAARGGVVVSVTHSNFRGGINSGAFGSEANVVQIMHDDGTFGLYAHLSWDSIRVRPGQRVSRGEYIAASGNTGFSTGPHLHFAVIRNDGLKAISVPVQFRVGQGDVVSPATGAYLNNP